MSPTPVQIVVPSEIPWEAMTGQKLEELLFWLCDAQGAVDVQWRTGAGGPSADGGRDVEATFHVVGEDGEMQPAHWWIQAKGRSRTLEPMAVKEPVITAAGSADVDVIVVATNSAFSNPTRDWVTEWARGHQRPKVLLWDRHALERMVVSHPSVIARVAPQALSMTGQLAAICARFHGSTRLAASHELAQLWEHLDELELSEREIVALVCAELEHGSVIRRPWMLALRGQDRAAVCAHGLADLPSLLSRASQLGVDTQPLFNLAEHLVAVALAFLPARLVRVLVENPWQFFDGPERSAEAITTYHDAVLTLPLTRLRERFGVRCAQDCDRMSADAPHDTSLDLLATLAGGEDDRETGQIGIETLDAACAAGLMLDENVLCPWFREAPFGDVLEEIQHALSDRLVHRHNELHPKNTR